MDGVLMGTPPESDPPFEAPEAPKRGRGRPPGSKNKTTAAKIDGRSVAAEVVSKLDAEKSDKKNQAKAKAKRKVSFDWSRVPGFGPAGLSGEMAETIAKIPFMLDFIVSAKVKQIKTMPAGYPKQAELMMVEAMRQWLDSLTFEIETHPLNIYAAATIAALVFAQRVPKEPPKKPAPPSEATPPNGAVPHAPPQPAAQGTVEVDSGRVSASDPEPSSGRKASA